MSAPATILVVDDEEFNREALTRRLRKRGYEVTAAANGESALVMIEQQRFDLILLDIMMPKMNGLQVLERLRKNHTAERLPVIMVTALDDSDDIAQALASGANDYLSKPVDITVLTARIETQLLHKQAEAILRQSHDELERLVEERTKALRASEQNFRALYDDNPSIFLTVDEQGTLTSVNRFGAQYLGYDQDKVIGMPLSTLFPERGLASPDRYLEACLQELGTVHRWDTQLAHRDHRDPIWVRASARGIMAPGGQSVVLMVCEDVTEARDLANQLSYEETHDRLTALINRHEFERQMQRLLREQSGSTNHPGYALCFAGLDHFKLINETMGHAAGDQLLHQLAARLVSALDRSVRVGRLGGDVFGIMSECNTRHDADRLGDAVLKTINDFRFDWSGQGTAITASIGIVQFGNDGKTVSEILQEAELACHLAKDKGGDRTHICLEGDTIVTERHSLMEWAVRVKQALEQDRFVLYAQNIVPLAATADQGIHFEILVRMIDDDGTLVPPGDFLPAVEQYNLSGRLDRWVIDATLKWLTDNREHLDNLSQCAINLSGLSVGDSETLDFLLEELSKGTVPPEKICFEVTETAAIANLAAAKHFIGELRKLGCHFALDDFGSGLSSFAYLKNLPVDILKIDGVFIKNIVDDQTDYAMVKSINEIAHVMHMKTIAEFVENQAIVERLCDIGVDYAQGYHLGKPAPLEDLRRQLLHGRAKQQRSYYSSA